MHNGQFRYAVTYLCQVSGEVIKECVLFLLNKQENISCTCEKTGTTGSHPKVMAAVGTMWLPLAMGWFAKRDTPAVTALQWTFSWLFHFFLLYLSVLYLLHKPWLDFPVCEGVSEGSVILPHTPDHRLGEAAGGSSPPNILSTVPLFWKWKLNGSKSSLILRKCVFQFLGFRVQILFDS